MVAGLPKLANPECAVPDYTTLCRRQKTLTIRIPCRRADGPLNLPVDSTGVKFPGDGEWQGVLEAMVRIPCPKPDRGEDALAGSTEPMALNLLEFKAFGERIAAGDPDRQTAEIRLRIAVMNRLSALGTAEIVRVA